MRSRLLTAIPAILAACSVCRLSAQAPIPPLTDAAAKEARGIIAQMKRNPRGPYGPIQWYCDDGRVLPPQGVPCGAGKGKQHAAPSPQAQRLAALNYDLARFFATMPYEQFVDLKRNHYWLRETVMLDYLVNREDGWIYKSAMQRRGVRQAEDEEKAARTLLSRLISNTQWLEVNYGLAVQVAVAVPHGLDTARLRKIRALSASLADKDARFAALRAKIHSKPGPDDIDGVKAFAAKWNPTDTTGFTELIKLLQAEYSEEDFGKSAAHIRALLKGTPAESACDAATAALERSPEEALLRGGELVLELRKMLLTPGQNSRRLDILDANLWILDQAFRYGAKAGIKPGSRRLHSQRLEAWIRYATAAGLLSSRQLLALEDRLALLLGSDSLSAEEYYTTVRYVSRSLEWARAAAAREFGEISHHYAIIEPAANGLLDDLLRRSVVLHLSREIELLLADAERAMGHSHDVLGKPVSQGVTALNPGVAVAQLEIVESGQESIARFDASKIYVIPETIADLKPVAGILTLDSGNALSHAQLLAAGLGIPNAAISSSILPELRQLRGQRIFFAVTGGGTVVLRRWDSMSEADRKLWTKQPQQSRGRVRLDTSKLDLNDKTLRTLNEIDKSDSGRIAGPKAANLGQLVKYFPDHIADGVVIPFGAFADHISAIQAGQGTLAQEIPQVYERAEKMRQEGASVAAIQKFVYPKLAQFRELIQKSPLRPEFEAELSRKLQEVFGGDGTYGVFVRSDTNAEDLPEFSGAGLNLTVPNVVGRDRILSALKEVWASPFRERAYDWRSQALESSAAVMPSVLLLRTVQGDKSGVLVTVDLDDLDPEEITVNVNEGVAAVVDGGVAESLLLHPNGAVTLLSQARSPYRRVALATGGFSVVPTTGSDYVLTGDETNQLRDLVREVKRKYPPTRDANGQMLPWDIEFGFEKGQLRLFQIRPLVRFREVETIESLARLDKRQRPAARVPMNGEVGQ